MQKDVNIGEIKPNTVLVVVGPTASGKSALAIELALKYNGVIINADASQVYKDIPIVSAAPDEDDKVKVEHVLYGILEADEKKSVSDWVKLATDAIKKVWDQGKLPIVTGGTGFYIESLINGMSPIPETKHEAKTKVATIFDETGVEGAYKYLQQVDSEGAKKVNPNDTTRVRRALEIFIDTGISISEWFEKPMTKDKFKVIEHTDNKWYAQYEGWKTNVWIGGYDTEKDVNDVIKSYIKETKKPPMYRNITNVHSVLLDM